ncbi:MAG: (d)CMP kinase [Lachnospiraceae bacterium]|nr:(d)CMP kinase [Lachnospiraceae bacterium]
MAQSIALDGPAGAGKSTIAKRLAALLGLKYVDTGAMYRTLGLACTRRGVDATKEEEVIPVLQTADIRVGYVGDTQHVYLDGEDVSTLIRTDEAGAMSSKVSVHPPVREKMVDMQRKLADEISVIMDGRDIGTVVLPNAFLKVFLTASVEERARRRRQDYLLQGKNKTQEEVEEEIRERDYRDSHREVGPLKQAEDAIRVDTTGLSIEQVVDTIRELYENRQKEAANA